MFPFILSIITNKATTLLKEVAGTVRNALGSTNSDNANQLGNKITTGISNQIKNQAVNKTEGLINSKANILILSTLPGMIWLGKVTFTIDGFIDLFMT
jgi:hypothetical protein